MLITSFTSKSGNNISIESPYKIVCRGVKTSSTAKKTICHKLEKQFSQLAGKIDKKPNSFIKRIKASKV
jgi:hypothetical protein